MSRTDWRPIETAPTDGTEFLVFYPDGEEGPSRIRVAKWSGSGLVEPADDNDWVSLGATEWTPLPEH